MKILLIYFLLFTFWLEKAYGFQLTAIRGMSLLNLCIYLLTIVWFFTAVRKRKLFEPSNLNKCLVLMFFVVAVSILVKIMLGELPYINIRDEVIAFKSWANPFIIFFVLLNILDDETTCKYALWGLICLLFISVFSTLLVAFWEIEVSTIAIRRDGRLSGFGNPNDYARYLVLFIPLVLSCFLFQKTSFKRLGSAILLVMTFTGLILTGSRGGILSFLFGILVYLAFLTHKKMVSHRTIICVGLTVILLGVSSYLVAPSQRKENLRERFDPTNSADMDTYTSGRTMLWRHGLVLFKESPLFGHGHNTFRPLVRKRFRVGLVAHNLYMSYMVEYGIIGLVILITILIKIYRHVWHHFSETTDFWNRALYLSYLAGFCGYTFSLLAGQAYTFRYIFWIYTATIYRHSTLSKAKQYDS